MEIFIASVVMPFIVSLLKNPAWSAELKLGLAIVVAVALGAAVAVVDGGVTLVTLTANIGQVLGYSQIFYGLIVKNTGINAKLEAVGH